MLCEKCSKNEATFYYHENVNGREKTYRLCRDCADEMQKNGEISEFDPDRFFGDFDSFFGDSLLGNPFRAMDNLLGGFFGSRGQLTAGRGNEKTCPNCGMTLGEFASSGMAGCPGCYEAFAKELEPAITNVHGRRGYQGHAPSKFRERMEKKHRIETLEAEQKDVIRREDYERAAEIRDELKALRNADAAAADGE